MWQSTDAAATACQHLQSVNRPCPDNRHDVIYVCQLHVLDISRQVNSKLPGAPVRLQLDYCLGDHPQQKSRQGQCITCTVHVSVRICRIYRVAQKTIVNHKVFPYLCQIFTDSQNFFTGAFCGKFVIKWLLNIPPHLNYVATLSCKYKICEIHHFGEYMNKSSELNFLAHPV